MEPLSSKILAANKALFEEGKREAIPDFFATDYIAHLTGQDLAGGHQLIRGMLDLYQRAFPNPKVEVEIFFWRGLTAFRGRGRSAPNTKGRSKGSRLPGRRSFGAMW